LRYIERLRDWTDGLIFQTPSTILDFYGVVEALKWGLDAQYSLGKYQTIQKSNGFTSR
jgi:hypothetical protein